MIEYLIKHPVDIPKDMKFSSREEANANCIILYSEDMQHNLKIENLTIKNPFKI